MHKYSLPTAIKLKEEEAASGLTNHRAASGPAHTNARDTQAGFLTLRFSLAKTRRHGTCSGKEKVLGCWLFQPAPKPFHFTIGARQEDFMVRFYSK